MTTNSAMAATTIMTPPLGAVANEGPVNSTMATPAGNRMAPVMWNQPCSLANVAVPAAGNQPVTETAARRRSG
jgi:hypothetical protein